MEKSDKQLLHSELSARMPYRVKCHYTPKVEDDFDHETDFYIKAIDVDGNIVSDKLSFRLNYTVESVKPYLRPMSSMTEEEKEQLAIIRSEDFRLVRQWVKNESIKETGTPCPVTCGEIDYCNKKHLDYRGLIPMGLALEAPEGMYKID